MIGLLLPCIGAGRPRILALQGALQQSFRRWNGPQVATQWNLHNLCWSLTSGLRVRKATWPTAQGCQLCHQIGLLLCGGPSNRGGPPHLPADWHRELKANLRNGPPPRGRSWSALGGPNATPRRGLAHGGWQCTSVVALRVPATIACATTLWQSHQELTPASAAKRRTICTLRIYRTNSYRGPQRTTGGSGRQRLLRRWN
mmetsp:Transcript_8703/g.20445  ORF Transcript_8703/g.20445 Transcript_8703/m.20445 type:complete len:200 (-) Transcript_8703:102-701(-)